MKTVLIIPLFVGTRRFMDLDYDKDRLFYFRQHIWSLTNIKHQINKVEFIFNTNDTSIDRIYFQKIQEILKSVNFNYELILRKNQGMSYGALIDRLRILNYDFYFFIEDDYIFIEDHFDEKMIDMINEYSCDYICGIADKLWGFSYHAANSIGILNKKAASILASLNIPNEIDNYHAIEHLCQVDYSVSLIENGCVIKDVTEKFGTVHFDGHGITKKGDMYKTLFYPCQCLKIL